MELALYCPDCGYYEKENDTVGRCGDFYTSVSVGPLFGELLAFQFAEWLEQSEVQSLKSRVEGQPGQVHIVEAGAHDGRLARDILRWLRLRRPALFGRVEYLIIEPSARRQAWQRKTLGEFAASVRWFERLPDLGNQQTPPVRGVIFSNELLDALPVHRLGWDAKQRHWFEWGVAANEKEFVWVRMPITSHASRFTPPVPPELLAALPDGFTTEVCPGADVWWREAGSVLKAGRLLTIDYGVCADELFQPERTTGTLRAYHRHHVTDDLLAHPGEQDLTAHVNFSAIQTAGETAGLKTDGFVTQAQFLTNIAQRVWQEGSGFGPWTNEHTRQFQTLTHPEHLGRAFRVLVQANRSAGGPARELICGK